MVAVLKKTKQANTNKKETSWVANLKLRFEYKDARTILSKINHTGPLVVQKPFYPEKNHINHTYIVHPPGGIVGGDTLHINIDCLKKGHALITNPGASKYYRTAGPISNTQQIISVEEGACVEWLPQENIVFDGALAKTNTCINLKNNASFLGWEITCLGRPVGEQPFSKGCFSQSFQIWHEGKPVFIDNTKVDGQGALMAEPWGLNGNSSYATLIANNATDTVLDMVRKKLAQNKICASATLIENLLVCRLISNRADICKNILISVWKTIRPKLLGHHANIPRIWNT